MSTPRIQATPKQMTRFRSRLNKCWLPVKSPCLPPQGEMVLVRFQINKEMVKVYTGKFQYNSGDDRCQVGDWQVPLNHARSHGLCGWMPIPS